MAELAQFGSEVTQAFRQLSCGSQTLIGAALGYFLLKVCGKPLLIGLLKATKPLRSKQKQVSEYKDGVVYLHGFPKKITKKVPNLSPFVLKVETWLRLHKIKFEFVETLQFSKSTRQFPYIIYNGHEQADSDLIIDFLEKEFDIDDNLTAEQSGIQRAFTSMIDEKTSNTFFLYRYNYGVNNFLRYFRPAGMSNFLMKPLIRKGLSKMIMDRTVAQGIGRKPRDVVIHIGNQDLQAVSLYLGDKSFLMGNKITRADCCMFGHLSLLLYMDLPYPFTEFMRRECPNLEPYINRIKAELYPDWTSIVDDSEFTD